MMNRAKQSSLTDFALRKHTPEFRRVPAPKVLCPVPPMVDLMLQRKPACACGGGCPRCQAAAFGLPISAPADQYKQEANRIAEQVMQMSDEVQVSPVMPAIQRKCATCEKVEEQEKLQTKLDQSPASCQSEANDTAANASSIVRETLRSPGQPLDPATRAFFEPRFGQDFSQVRVHTDAKAAESAWAVNALAYTAGRDIVFGTGRYAPATSEGRRLLAHELTHVVQQHGDGWYRLDRQLAKPSTAKTRVQFEDCSGPQQDDIREKTAWARAWVNNAVTKIEAVLANPAMPDERTHRALRKHFRLGSDRIGGNIFQQLAAIRQEFIRLREAIGRELPFECESDCGNAVGYILGGIPILDPLMRAVSDIHLCPSWFNRLSSDDKVVTLIHEVAHKYTWKHDFAYEFNKDDYAKLSATQAIRNADSYACFARDVD